MAQQQQGPYYFLQRLFIGQHRIVRNLQEQLKAQSKQIHQLQQQLHQLQQLQQEQGHWQPQSWAWSDWSSARWQQQQGHCQRQSWAWSNWSSAWWHRCQLCQRDLACGENGGRRHQLTPRETSEISANQPTPRGIICSRCWRWRTGSSCSHRSRTAPPITLSQTSSFALAPMPAPPHSIPRIDFGEPDHRVFFKYKRIK